MATMAVFAEFWRDTPLVRSSTSPEFTLLFNQGDDNVRARSQWDPSRDPADFALLLRKVRVRGGRHSWVVRPHEDSPTQLVTRVSSFKTAVISDEKPLAAGEVFSFSFKPLVFQKEIRMMLCGTEPTKRAKKPLKKGAMRVPFEKLPKEAINKIASNLPWMDVVYLLPFVSEALFKVAKSVVGPWAKLIFESSAGIAPTARELEAICKAACQTCETLAPLALCSSEEYYLSRTEGDCKRSGSCPVADHYINLLTCHRWSKVSELFLIGYVRQSRFDPEWLQHGLRKGNFENLAELMLLEVNLRWDIFHRCSFPALTSLKVELYETMKPGMKSKFSASFPSLKKVDIRVEDPKCWNDLLPLAGTRKGGSRTGNYVPVLEIICVSGLSPKPQAVERELAAFGGGSVTKLEFYSDHEDDVSDTREVEVLRGELLFALFPGTTSMNFNKGIAVDWNGVAICHLRQIESLIGEVIRPVPYHHMRKLKFLVATNAFGLTLIRPYALPLRGLFNRPQLEELHVEFDKEFFEFFEIPDAASVNGVSPCLTKLKLGFSEVELDDHFWEHLSRVLPCFPRLQCLSLHFRGFPVTAQSFTTVIAEKAANLVHLTLVDDSHGDMFLSDYEDEAEARQGRLDRIRELANALPVGWMAESGYDGVRLVKSGVTTLDHEICFSKVGYGLSP